MTTLEWITIAAFVAIAFVVYLLGRWRLAANHPIRRRLTDPDEADRPASQTAAAFAEGLAAQLPMRTSDRDELDAELRRAGWYRPNARTVFLAWRNGLAIAFLMIAGVAVVVIGPERPDDVNRALGIGIGAAALAWGVPRIWLRSVGQRRVKRIQRALPDALDLVTMCLTGGLSLRESLSHVCAELALAHPDLATELTILQRQSDMRSFEMAFEQLARRIDAPEVVALSALVTQGQRLGTDVAASIREYADGVRLKRRQLADERSSKAGVKMLFPLTLCALPSVFIILWGPSVLELWQFFQGFDGATEIMSQ
jgi:tight adherence protein C